MQFIASQNGILLFVSILVVSLVSGIIIAKSSVDSAFKSFVNGEKTTGLKVSVFFGSIFKLAAIAASILLGLSVVLNIILFIKQS